MKPNIAFIALSVVLVGAIAAPSITSAQQKPKPKPKPMPKVTAMTYNKDVAAGMTKMCAGCHTGANAPEGLDLSSYAGLMKGSKRGKVIVPGHPEKSLLIGTLHGKPKLMPPKKALDAKIIAGAELWVKQGAKEK